MSICTTNYNCAHALARHLESVFSSFVALPFEYIVVDNLSRDGSLPILDKWSRNHPNMKVLSRRCTMGEGRQIAFENSTGTHVMIVDTDVVYNRLLRGFVDRYFERYRRDAVQALYCGIFPRDQWQKVGGRRSLNTNEDVDMWVRMHRLGTMRWYPVALGENVKEAEALGSADYLSRRYSRREALWRLLRREWDLWKTRDLEHIDLGKLVAENTVDFGLGPPPGTWPQSRGPRSRKQHTIDFLRDLRRVARSESREC